MQQTCYIERQIGFVVVVDMARVVVDVRVHAWSHPVEVAATDWHVVVMECHPGRERENRMNVSESSDTEGYFIKRSIYYNFNYEI